MNDESNQHQIASVSGLLDAVHRIINAHRIARELYLHRFSPDFSAFDFIEPDELQLSKILAWFLDPHQTHGQGGLFLRLFLGALRIDAPDEDCERASVRTEFFIKGGRLDVLVSTSTFRVAIENKPWAGDQHEQLRRYFAYFDGSGQTPYWVIYLTSRGAEPPSIPCGERIRRIESGSLRLWSYSKELLSWLAKCRAECKSDRVSMFIDEFCRYIQMTFEGVRDSTMSGHLIDEITGSAEKTSAAMKVIALSDSIRKRLLMDLRQQVASLIPDRDVKVSAEPWARYSGIDIGFSEKSPYRFGMEFQNTQWNGLIVGIKRKQENSSVVANEDLSLSRALGDASQSRWWLWYRNASTEDSFLPVARNWSEAAEPWPEIANGNLASRLVNAFGRAHQVLEECGVG